MTRRLMAPVVVVSTCLACGTAVLPAVAGADATVAPPPIFSSATGLPDGRVYEEVSPPNKDGNSAGARFGEFGTTNEGESVARADGNAVLFLGEGAIGEAAGGLDSVYVAERSAGGWVTRSALPAPWDLEEIGGSGLLSTRPLWIDPAADLSHVLFTSEVGYVHEPPYEVNAGGEGANEFANIYLAGSNPLAEPAWLARPGGGNVTVPPEAAFAAVPIGGSRDLSTSYFAYPGTLGLPEDAQRAPHVSGAEGTAWGFYESRDGVLSEAGVLPDGSVSPFGAVPAALAAAPGTTAGDRRIVVPADQLDNEVSSDGSRALFVSPDPQAPLSLCTAGTAGGCTPELYVRETAPDGSQSTVLVSQSQLPGEVGQPAADGPAPVLNVAPAENYGSRENSGSYAYASPDGSQVFFASVDRLTESAPSGTTALKQYDFDVATGVLSYLPGVSGSIVASAPDGSSFLFEDTIAPFALERWSAGPGGGTVTQVAQLPGPASCEAAISAVCVGPARVSADGSVFVFATSAPIAGFNNGGGFGQVYRLDVAANTLSCVSCPPIGTAPSGDAVLSNLAIRGATTNSGAKNGLVENRGISAGGGRVFFDTPAPLVSRDVNGKYDVYAWEEGTVYLISSGTSAHDSLLMDNSPSGEDLFFTTTDGLVPGDTEGGYDVYDARVPQPGDSPPAAAVPCQGNVCQGPPSAPALLGAPASTAFEGLGNVPPQPLARPAGKPKPKPKAKPKRCKRGAWLEHGRCVRAKKSKTDGRRPGQ